MKIEPLDILLNEELNSDINFYLLSGNETTLMQKIADVLIEKYKKKENIETSQISTIDNFICEDSLFENRKIFIGNNCKGLNEKNLGKINELSDIFIFIQENSQKIKSIKNFFAKSRGVYLIDCYELSREAKIKILNSKINKEKINISDDIYWLLIDKLDSRYVFFESDIKKILELDSKYLTIENVKKLLTKNISGVEKVFFNLLKKNNEIINIYREKITSNADVNELYYYCRYFCQQIIESKNERDYTNIIPRYLFKEKNFLLNVYRKYNFRKKKILLRLLSSTEISLRTNGGLSIISGLRFLLKVKKITIS
tara:strand:+ start:3344 stop:4282 length:939 start_codon:yes stop_codon:yes gene_type:complete